jgi:hypothetical protein
MILNIDLEGGMGAWAGLIWLRMVINGELFEHSHEHSGIIK